MLLCPLGNNVDSIPEVLTYTISITMDTAEAKKNVLGFCFDAVEYEDILSRILDWRRAGQKHMISLVNPYSVLLGHRDVKMAQAIRASSLVLPDGVGIIHASRLLGYSPFPRVTGPALMLNLCDCSRPYGLRHYFYGGSETAAGKLADRLQSQFAGLQVAGRQSPPFRPLTEQEDAQVVRQINQSHPDIVWVGLGAPKQEKWMLDHLNAIEATVLIGVGAAFDFHSGNKPWAPLWMRRCGMEWAHRLCLEPRRMWRRNLASLVFLGKVLRQSFMIHWAGHSHRNAV